MTGENKGSQILLQFLAHNLSTYGIADFEILIDDPSRKNSEIVTFRSESRAKIQVWES